MSKNNNNNLENIFKSQQNVLDLAKELYIINIQSGNTLKKKEIYEMTLKLIDLFTLENNINFYQPLEYGQSILKNYTNLLNDINKLFINFSINFLRQNVFIPTRTEIEVGDTKNRYNKKMFNINVGNYDTLELWKPQNIYLTNDRYRDNNAIPFWRKNMHKRNIDNYGEGTKYNLLMNQLENNQTHRYNKNIYTIEKNNDNWFTEY